MGQSEAEAEAELKDYSNNEAETKDKLGGCSKEELSIIIERKLSIILNRTHRVLVEELRP
jgi:hypothetical protein